MTETTEKQPEPTDIFLWANQADAHKDALEVDLFLFTKGYTVYATNYAKELKALEATIETASVNTQNDKRDEHLRSADFFNAAKFDKITYKMVKFEKESDTEGKVVGTLTMHGVTKPVVLRFELGGFTADKNGKEKIGFSLEGETKRKLFEIGLDTSEITLSDKVELEIEIEAKEK